MHNVNSIVICRDNFNSEKEFEDNIRDTVMCLLKNRYIMTVDYEEPGLGIVSICYSTAHKEYGDAYPYFITPEEVELLTTEDWEEN